MYTTQTYCVILAGGEGNRFWPYSRKSMPKQFLDFFGLGETLLQMTYRRLSKSFSPDRILVSTNINYVEIVQEQLPDLPKDNIISEPCRRNTTASCALATLHLLSRDRDAKICFAPSDHLVLDHDLFIKSMKQAASYIEENDEALLTIGIAPSRPDIGYGYIQVDGKGMPEDPLGHVLKAKTFTEKPKMEIARIFIESGEFFWNSGMLFASGAVLLKALREYAPELMERLEGPDKESLAPYGTPNEKAHVAEAFPYCPSISIDYTVLEKASNVYVLIADFGWADLGTWRSVYEIGEKDERENMILHTTVLENDSHRNLVVSDTPGRLVVMQGVEDLFVVEKDKVLLICKRGEEQKVKQLHLSAASKGKEYL
ncbi:MAG: mannose-1-phosphate guanylyltransferase [Porphyromonas sp.]|nr:mannose-1-phosphate guanylyltransferase [Porphyromonas sp.]